MSFPLTKSHFLAGLQRPKRLWLAVCKPEYVCLNSLTQQREQAENQKFKTIAQRSFPGKVAEVGLMLSEAMTPDGPRR